MLVFGLSHGEAVSSDGELSHDRGRSAPDRPCLCLGSVAENRCSDGLEVHSSVMTNVVTSASRRFLAVLLE